jgi:5-methylthioribose kinase
MSSSSPLKTPPGYRALDEAAVGLVLAELPSCREALGGGPADWRVEEVGDGNLNLVFLVSGPEGGLCVKQALPYVRLVGEGWPMPLERATFEHACLVEHGRHAGRLLPRLYHYDPALFLIVMERLSPHVIMRRGMIKRVRYPRFAGDIAEYLAQTLFNSSDLALPAAAKRPLVARFCGNVELCKITEDLIFTEPYMVAERNRWTSPQLDVVAQAFREDAALKVAISRLKLKFLSSAEALLHGDLHTGSIMVTADDTRVIDPEFAFFGPMGFDVGAVIGNLLLNYFSQDGHPGPELERHAYQLWVLETCVKVWTGFSERFCGLWREHGSGDAYPRALFTDAASAAALEAERERYMRRLLADTLGFAGAKMIRRILGLAHNIDLEWIEDADTRASCERRCLALGRDLAVNAERYEDMAQVIATAREVRVRGAVRV